MECWPRTLGYAWASVSRSKVSVSLFAFIARAEWLLERPLSEYHAFSQASCTATPFDLVSAAMRQLLAMSRKKPVA